MSTCACFDAFQREEHDAVKIMSIASLVKKLFAETRFFAKKRYFDLSLPLQRNVLKSGQFL